jgi:hypothetical protein
MFVQVYRLLPPSGDRIAVNKYHIIYRTCIRHIVKVVIFFFLYERLTGRNCDVRTVRLRNVVVPGTSILTMTM